MKRYKKILVAFDGSLDGMEALNAAETLAKDNDAQLTVVYVHEKPREYSVSLGTTATGNTYLFQSQSYLGPGPGAVTGNAPPFVEEQERMIVEDEIPDHVMSQAKHTLSKELNVTYETLSGKPAAELTNYAKENDIDLIVIGNRGISGIKKFVMGSVSQKVSNDAECAVFVVK